MVTEDEAKARAKNSEPKRHKRSSSIANFEENIGQRRKISKSSSNHNKMASDFASNKISNFSNVKKKEWAKHHGIGGPINSKKGAKRIVVKNLKEKPNPLSNFQAESWSKLKGAVIAIQEESAISFNREELFEAVQIMCDNDMSSELYEQLKDMCKMHVEKLLVSLLQNLAQGGFFLKTMHKCWNKHCQQMLMIRSIFLSLDRKFVRLTPKIPSIWDVGLDLFRQHVLSQEQVKESVLLSILSQIENERKGDIVDRGLLKGLLRMMTDLQMYKPAFEGLFLDKTEQLYKSEGVDLCWKLDVPEYLHHVERRLEEEKERLNYYLDHSTRRPLLSRVETQLIAVHVSTILQKGLDQMLDSNRIPHLKLLYKLLSLVPTGLKQLCESFLAYTKRTGKATVLNPDRDSERDKKMVQNLLNFKMKLDNIIAICFNQDEQFVVTLREAFENFINQRQNKPAELIAKFIDSKLRSGNKEASEEELERLLDKIMVLFRFIHGKDVFEAFYKKDLAKRLIVGRSASVDAEKSMLIKLKQECGGGFTSKLEGMFKDEELSRDFMANFKQHLSTLPHPPTADIMVHILTSGFWPTYAICEVNIPEEMLNYQKLFEKFYLGKHSGRKLQWQPKLGQCVLKAQFRTCRKELVVSLFQTIVLLLFNEANCLTYAQIIQMSEIEEEELKRTLQSLACGKTRVLLKDPKGKEVSSSDSFTFNEDFTDKLVRVSIKQVQMRETEQENEDTTKRVFQDRQYQVDAAIVRIMKTRKTLHHTLLINELYEQLKFPVKPIDLKKRIESLIDRDYMARDADNTNEYHYVA